MVVYVLFVSGVTSDNMDPAHTERAMTEIWITSHDNMDRVWREDAWCLTRLTSAQVTKP